MQMMFVALLETVAMRRLRFAIKQEVPKTLA
jgi:hypothetical protein